MLLLLWSSHARGQAQPPASPPPAASEPRELTIEALLTLDELLNIESTVTSQKSRTARQAPGIVTVITREEIVSSGARDLLDVLRLVPGFTLGSDVQGTVGAAFRGVWGFEGKVLLMLDGLEVNELLYSTVQLGQHYPVDDVERIEIIRGPGSAIYGGHAELAVINVITRSASAVNGVWGTATGSRSFGGMTGGILSVGGGKEFAPGVGVSLSASIGQGNRSDLPYTDFAGTSYSMQDNSRLDPLLAKGAFTYHGLKVRLLFDRYRMQTRDGLDLVLDRTAEQTFTTFMADAQYELHPLDKLTITPRLTYAHQLPWQVLDLESALFYDKTATRLTASVTGTYDFTPDVSALLAVEGRRDAAWLNSTELVGLMSTFADGSSQVAYLNLALAGQVLWDNPIVNVTAGARYELHSAFGSSFVPRVGFTKVIDRFHAKLLYSQAFRAPGIENIRLTPDIKPERTHAFEAEVGYRLGEHLYAGVNAFDLTIERPIVYFYDGETDSEGYLNEALTGSRGVEVEVRVKHPLGWANLSWSWATNGAKGGPASYAIPGRTDLLVGMPAHKVALNGALTPVRGLSLNPSATFMSERFGYLAGDVDGAGVLSMAPPVLLLNLFVSYQIPTAKGLQVSAGVYNLLDARVLTLQPYNGGHAPLPGAPRELLARVSYQYTFD